MGREGKSEKEQERRKEKEEKSQEREAEDLWLKQLKKEEERAKPRYSSTHTAAQSLPTGGIPVPFAPC